MRAQLTVEITAWNIQGVRDKLETEWVRNILQRSTFIFLTETKTSEEPRLSGFKTINNPAKSSHRGGVAVLVKNFIFSSVCKIDKSYEGVVVFELNNIPFVTFILCYIAPDDSPYYDKAIFGHLHSVLNKEKDNTYVLLGDLNARISTPDLSMICSSLRYPTCKDERTNLNGQLLLSLCRDNKMVIVNNAQVEEKQFPSMLSFRKGANWVSELDYCLVSLKGLEHLGSLDMKQEPEGRRLPSDHAMLTVGLLFDRCTIPGGVIKHRARNLGISVFDIDEKIQVRKSTSMRNVNKELVINHLITHPPPDVSNMNEEEMVSVFFEEAETILKANRMKKEEHNAPFVSNRWKRIFELNDSRMIWKAIGWNGEIVEEFSQAPSDLESKSISKNCSTPSGWRTVRKSNLMLMYRF